MSIHPGHWLGPLVCGLLALPAALMAGQGLVQIPIHDFSGTIALPESVDKFYSDVNKILVTTGSGINRVTRTSKGPKAHDGESLDNLKPGTAVVVHYTVKGILASADDTVGIDEDRRLNEGVVTSVDRSRKRITIRFANGMTETLRSARPAAPDSAARTRSRVVVYYPDESGRRVAHYFKPTS